MHTHVYMHVYTQVAPPTEALKNIDLSGNLDVAKFDGQARLHIRACTHVDTHTRTRTRTRMRNGPCTRAHTHSQWCALTSHGTRMRAHTHACTHERVHARVCVHTHTPVRLPP